jgi:hypothetical protein
MKLIDLAGITFGRLKVARHVESNAQSRDAYWECVCECGSIIRVRGTNLRSGQTQSCGCYQKQRVSEAQTKHGCAKPNAQTPEYKVWSRVIARCCDPKSDHFDRYGGRGIEMCWRWRNSFENFLADMGPRPSPNHSIERENNNGNYEPGNCRWATRAEQSVNKSNTVMVRAGGKEMSLAVLAREANLPVQRVYQRIFREKWSIERALNTPIRSFRRLA